MKSGSVDLEEILVDEQAIRRLAAEVRELRRQEDETALRREAARDKK